VAVVTGGSRGIGCAVSKRLGDLGYRVAVVYRSEKASADGVVDHIVSRGGTAMAFQCDVGREAEIVRLFEEVKLKLGASSFVNARYLVTGPTACHPAS
jgi:NAD(P)-dependent dehydrogenase (short-subunit alcohol dehydrogenase family)